MSVAPRRIRQSYIISSVQSMLIRADLSGAPLDDADLRDSDLEGIAWQHLKSLKGANIAGVRNAPAGVVAWALKNGAVQETDAE
jgi:uncharacterized protein YjbI with pentapeptide repeats